MWKHCGKGTVYLAQHVLKMLTLEPDSELVVRKVEAAVALSAGKMKSQGKYSTRKIYSILLKFCVSFSQCRQRALY